MSNQILVFLAILVCCFHKSIAGSYMIEPQTTTSAVGASARFLCQVIINKATEKIYWHFEPNEPNNRAEYSATIGPFVNENPTAYDRYKITGDSETGVYNFEIIDITTLDEGEYSCLIVSDSSTDMKSASLLLDDVAKPNEAATCDNGNLRDRSSSSHREGDIVTISCSITGGVPTPLLQIVRYREGYSTYEVIPSSALIDNNKLKENATFSLSHVDNMARYSCLALHPSDEEDTELSCDFTSNPNVRFTPIVSISPSEVYVEDDDDNEIITLTCNVIANPEADDINWIFVSGKLTTAMQNGNELKFDGVHKHYIGETVTCNATNSVGSGISSITIQEDEPLLPFDTYILIIIIAAGCLVFFIFSCICIICCCQKKDDEDDDEDKSLGYHVNDSRPTSIRHNDNDDMIDGYDADDFSGGSEANLMREESHKSRASHKSRVSQRSVISDRTDNRSSVRSNTYDEESTFENQAYSPDDNIGNNDVEFNTPLY